MEMASLAQAGVLVFIAFVTALAALLASGSLFSRKSGRDRRAVAEVAFLFDGGTLVDATAAGRRLLQYATSRGSDMARLVAFLAPRFPDLHARVQTCGENDRMLLLSSDNRARLRIESRSGRLRISLEDVQDEQSETMDRHSQAVLSAELDAHRDVSDHMPIPIWRLDAKGHVTWANGAYWALAERAGLSEGVAPGAFPLLFPGVSEVTLPAGATHRLQLIVPDVEDPLYFDASVALVGRDRLLTAVPADAVVGAERNLREFIQTLTQTFAHLSVGLAIFDRRRELTLFNPALGDLLGLEVEFLVARPPLMRFLDHLRERNMMPEPKDYKSWRQRMTDLETAATESGKSETWALPDGRTLRITGRPHPDGAVAFLFEDISSEIRLSREYRSELETGHAVIDTLDEAIAVFSADGRLNFANRAYGRLWTGETASRPGVPFLEASRQWQQQCAPSPVWGDARDFAAEMSGRSTWHAEVRLTDGRPLVCRFEPLPGGGTMAGFSEPTGGALQPRSVADTGPVKRTAAGA